MRTFEVHHFVSFEETNLVGNVYFVNHLRWQGFCREQFLRERVPHLAAQLRDVLALVTVRCSCEYLAEVVVFDEIIVRMSLGSLSRNRMTLEFDYYRTTSGVEELIARGFQEIACMHRRGDELKPGPFPAELVEALEPFRVRGRLGAALDPPDRAAPTSAAIGLKCLDSVAAATEDL